jgi:YbbR domain-containing protein
MSVVTDLALPAGVLPLGDSSVTVRVTFRLVSSTRTLSAGVVLLGARLGYTYRLDVEQVLVTVGGSSADLGLIDAASFTVRLDVTTLEPGTHEVAVTADLPSGISLITASPAAVSVTVTGPASSATASASPTAGP